MTMSKTATSVNNVCQRKFLDGIWYFSRSRIVRDC